MFTPAFVTGEFAAPLTAWPCSGGPEIVPIYLGTAICHQQHGGVYLPKLAFSLAACAASMLRTGLQEFLMAATISVLAVFAQVPLLGADSHYTVAYASPELVGEFSGID